MNISNRLVDLVKKVSLNAQGVKLWIVHLLLTLCVFHTVTAHRHMATLENNIVYYNLLLIPTWILKPEYQKALTLWTGKCNVMNWLNQTQILLDSKGLKCTKIKAQTR